MLPFFLGLATLSVDLSVLAVARGQLSTAADAGALAGARKLADAYRLRLITDVSAQIGAANASASQFVLANSVLGQAPVIVQNPNNSPSGDIVVGYLDPANPSGALSTSTSNSANFNAVQVTTSRNSTHGGSVPSFFGKLMGYQGSNPSVTSTAIAQNYTITSFKSVNNLPANLLPIVLDINTYNQMMAGTTTDQYTWDPATQAVKNGADGVWETQLYPVSSGSPGNWGTIKVGVSNNSTSTLGAQIRSGITPAQLATFPNGTIVLDQSMTPPQITFGGNPGISAGIKDDLAAIIGKPVAIPIYDTNGGNGNNAWYRVVAFFGARILSVNFQGNPKYVVIQPALIDDPTANPGTTQSSWKAGGLIVVHLAK
jgi:hypothetical protein